MSTPPRTPPRHPLPPDLDPRGPRRPLRPYGAPRRRRRVLRTLSWAAVVLSALVLLVSVAGYAAFTYYSSRLHRVSVPTGGGSTVGQNYLLVGSDTRNFAGGQAFQAPKGSPDYVTGQRSDTVMLAHVPAGGAKATIVSFPRDSWVQIPAYTDAQGQRHDAHMSKINAAFALGGPPLLVRTIEHLTGLGIDHYVQIDFAGFQKMVNALGGITLCVGTTRNDHDSGDHLTKGVHHVGGAAALAFVRDRKGLPNGDIDRIKDQQYFISQVVKKVTSAGTLANPFKLNAFLTSVTDSVTVDKAFGFSDMRTLALRFRHLDPAHVTFETLPYTTDNGYRDGQSVVLIDQAKADAMFATLRGEHPKTTTAPSYKVTVPPSKVSLTVLNGSGRNGLAGDTRDQLRGEGFTVAGIGNAAPTQTTVVRYPKASADAARTVAAAVPGATLQEDSTAPGVVLVLGDNFSSVRPVQVGGSAAAGRPSTSASPSPPGNTAATVDCAP